jgi:Transcription termination factor nusG
MPILPLEPFVYPDNLLTVPEGGMTDTGRWWVLHTRPRAEKALARRFLSRGLSFFLPLHERQVRVRGRLLRSYSPLFTSYIFLHGDDESRVHALETNLVAQTLPVADQRRLHLDLSRVYHLISTGAPLTPEDQLLPGTPVLITRGSLAGLEGKVIRQGKNLKVFVEVQFLQRGVSVEIESWMLEAVTG